MFYYKLANLELLQPRARPARVLARVGERRAHRGLEGAERPAQLSRDTLT